MKPRYLRSLAALAVAAVFGPSPADAEISPHELTRPAAGIGLGPGYGQRDLQFHLDVGTYFGSFEDEAGFSEDRFALSPRLRVMQPVGFNEAELSLGFIWLDKSGDAGDAQTFQLGNIYAAHYWVWRTLGRQIRLGAGLGAPTAILRDEQPRQTLIDNEALITAAGMRSGREYWLWTPETGSVVGHFDFYERWPFGLVLGGRLSVAGLYGFDDSPSTVGLGLEGFNLLAQVDLDVAFDTESVRTMLRASYVLVPLNEGEFGWLAQDEIDQIGAEVEFRIRLGRADVVLRLDVPIDAPFGFAFDDGGIWGAHIGVSSPTELRLPEE